MTELRHHGILGMKWGVRRYQNPDGSLTASGELRYHGREHGEKQTAYLGKKAIDQVMDLVNNNANFSDALFADYLLKDENRSKGFLDSDVAQFREVFNTALERQAHKIAKNAGKGSDMGFINTIAEEIRSHGKDVYAHYADDEELLELIIMEQLEAANPNSSLNKKYMDSLQHHGILGMKWGVRRYQNPDGSLTPAGQVRYGGDPSNDSDSSKPKSTSEMSNKELKDATERLRLQTEYEKAKSGYNEQTKSYTRKKLAQLRDKAIDSLITKSVEAATSAFVRKAFGIQKVDNNKGGNNNGGNNNGGGKGGKGGSMGVGSIRENLGITDEQRFRYRVHKHSPGYTIKVKGAKPKK